MRWCVLCLYWDVLGVTDQMSLVQLVLDPDTQPTDTCCLSGLSWDVDVLELPRLCEA